MGETVIESQSTTNYLDGAVGPSAIVTTAEPVVQFCRAVNGSSQNGE